MSVGVVIIGRNEGVRLSACLQSVQGCVMVYVDSGSTDNSVENAKNHGAEVLELDMSIPFSAARGRNAGYQHLLEQFPDTQYVQFVDGDCEVVPGWIHAAREFLKQNPEYAVACGRRIEKNPGASIFNALCEIEWNTPPGDAAACGGDAMYRSDTLATLGGFDPSFIAGEEPELCFRIRQTGKKIKRIDEDMTLHDADMHQLSQWWKRSLRSGYAYALNYSKHGRSSQEKFKLREVRSIVAWNLLGAFAFLASLFFKTVIPLCIFLVLFLLMTLKIFFAGHRIKRLYGGKMSFAYAISNMLAKLPQFSGMVKFWLKERSGEKHTLVEYK